VTAYTLPMVGVPATCTSCASAAAGKAKGGKDIHCRGKEKRLGDDCKKRQDDNDHRQEKWYAPLGRRNRLILFTKNRSGEAAELPPQWFMGPRLSRTARTAFGIPILQNPRFCWEWPINHD